MGRKLTQRDVTPYSVHSYGFPHCVQNLCFCGRLAPHNTQKFIGRRVAVGTAKPSNVMERRAGISICCERSLSKPTMSSNESRVWFTPATAPSSKSSILLKQDSPVVDREASMGASDLLILSSSSSLIFSKPGGAGSTEDKSSPRSMHAASSLS